MILCFSDFIAELVNVHTELKREDEYIQVGEHLLIAW